MRSAQGCAYESSTFSEQNEAGWRAELRLSFRYSDDRTILSERRHVGPLLVQRPFYPEGSTCHVYLLHPPGGVVGGDTLEVSAICERGAQVLLTTPAAGKFYRSNGRTATQEFRFRVLEGAVLEWLPQESILFDQAKLNSLTRFDIGGDARLMAWEIVCLGRPACREGFARGQARVGLEVWKKSKRLLVERMSLNAATSSAICGLNNHPVVGTMIAYPAARRHLDAARDVAENHAVFGATLIEELLVCRALGHQAEPVRALFTSVWREIRPDLAGRQACLPRVWGT